MDIQALEDCIRKYEEAKGAPYDSDLKLRRILDILPADVERHMVPESKGEYMTYDDVRNRAVGFCQTMTEAPKDYDPMDIGAVVGKGICDDNGQDWYSPGLQHGHNLESWGGGYQDQWDGGGGVNGLQGKGGKTKGVKGKGKDRIYDGYCYDCGAYGHTGKYCPNPGSGKGKGGSGGNCGGKHGGNRMGGKQGGGKYGKGGGKGWAGGKGGGWNQKNLNSVDYGMGDVVGFYR